MLRSFSAAFALLAIAAACSAVRQAVPIIKDVNPLPAMALSEICVQTNHGVTRQRFDEDLTALFREFGLSSRPKESAFRGECRVWASYDAAYAGRLPPYLSWATIDIHDEGQRIGYIRYDASQGHGRMDRHGTTVSRLRPLVSELLARVQVE